MARLLLLAAISALLWPPPASAFPFWHHKKPAPVVPLNAVAAEVVHTFDAFNAEAASRDLPPLAHVTLDFNTSTTSAVDAGFNVLVFSLGAHREADTTNEVTFTYTVPPPPEPGALAPRTRPADFSSTLLQSLEAAAAQVKQTKAIGAARLSSVTLTLAYGVASSVSGGAAGVISLITLNGTVSRHRSDVQTLTLTFGQ